MATIKDIGKELQKLERSCEFNQKLLYWLKNNGK